jgi:hypothetical protein
MNECDNCNGMVVLTAACQNCLMEVVEMNNEDCASFIDKIISEENFTYCFKI